MEHYKEITEQLHNDVKRMFIGLPCDVGVLKTYLKKEYSNLITVELICYGPHSPKVADQQITRLETDYQSQVTEFFVRYKQNGWTQYYLRAVFGNGQEFTKLFSETEYGKAYFSLTRPSCFSCRYKGNSRTANITIGDYCGCTNKDTFWNKDCVSSLFVHTEKGEETITNLPDFKLTQVSYEHAAKGNPNIINVRDKPTNRDKFSIVLCEEGLFTACKKTRSKKSEIIKLISGCMPARLKKKLKNIIK